MVEFTESKFRQKVDFVTSSRRNLTDRGSESIQEEVIITDKCVIRMKGEGHSEITAVYSDTDTLEVGKLAEKMNIVFPSNVRLLDEPTEEEIEILESMDPEGAYLR